MNLELRRQGRREVDDLVVEQGHAGFDRVRHAHAIHLGEDVFGEIRLEVEVHQLRVPGQSIEPGEVPAEA